MRTVIIKSLHPITIQDNSSDEMRQFAEKWMSSGLIQHLRSQFAQIAPIPENGFELTPYIGRDVGEIKEFNQKHFQMVSIGLPKALLHQYNLGESWLWLLMFSLYFNAVIDLEENPAFLDKDPILFVAGKKEIAKKLFDFEGREVVALLLPFHTSRHQIHDWIDKHAKEMERAMDNKLGKAMPLFEYLQNWSIGQEIEFLKKQGLSYKEISIKLTDKYPMDKRMCDFDQIKKLLKRYQEIKDSFDEHFKALLAYAGDK